MAKRYELGFGVGKDRHGKTVKRLEEKIARILTLACERFGGAALIPVEGIWKSPAGVVVKEPGYILRIDDVVDGRVADAKTLAVDVRIILEQESVVFSVSEVQTEFL